ncbi:response regulator [Aquimarina agarilytica]|uniref:response regulator n=1 Tax=Aquimarina agarilytica TaxID=1087449 RepID=UPI000288C872|nr:response regulator [Aquimarina agarilytica]
MFKKVLIAEDFDTNNKQLVQLLLQDIEITHVESAFYCDDAFLKFRKAQLDHAPFELLITDLSFTKDHRTQKLTKGTELIEAIKNIQPSIKVIVFSMENRPSKIKQLITNYSINGFIPKGRSALKELTSAVKKVHQGDAYFPFELEQRIKKDDLQVLENYDKKILTYISQGLTKEEVSELFKQKNIKPSSVSSIEKRLQKLYISFNAKNTVHLVAIAQGDGLI